MDKLTFGKAKNNNKLFANKFADVLFTFSLPSGYTCPGARECLARANRTTGKLTDGPDTQFRCFSASQEALYPNVRKVRWSNFLLLKNSPDMVQLILDSLPEKAKAIRLHVSGDYFNKEYFLAWLEVARSNPDILFYGYTKSLLYWITHRENIPKNFRLIASYGGKYDDCIDYHNLPNATVVYSEEEAHDKGLEIDHDDSLAMDSSVHEFAILIHGTQPAGSRAGKAVAELRKHGFMGYSDKRRLSLQLVH